MVISIDGALQDGEEMFTQPAVVHGSTVIHVVIMQRPGKIADTNLAVMTHKILVDDGVDSGTVHFEVGGHIVNELLRMRINLVVKGFADLIATRIWHTGVGQLNIQV